MEINFIVSEICYYIHFFILYSRFYFIKLNLEQWINIINAIKLKQVNF